MANLLLVEDHPVVTLGLRAVVSNRADLIVIGEAASSSQALDILSREHVDLVVLPLRLEGRFEGIELCREIKSKSDGPRVLVYTAYNSQEDATATFLSGADSFLHKGHDEKKILEIMDATLAGHRSWLLGIPPEEKLEEIQARVEDGGLTRREHETLNLMLQRLSNKQISLALHIEVATVKTHVSNILSKLGLRSRQDLF